MDRLNTLVTLSKVQLPESGPHQLQIVQLTLTPSGVHCIPSGAFFPCAC